LNSPGTDYNHKEREDNIMASKEKDGKIRAEGPLGGKVKPAAVPAN